MSTMVVSMWCNILGQEIIFYLSCLWEAVHYFSGIIIDMFIFLHNSMVVLCYYSISCDVDWKENMFIAYHGSAYIKIIDVAAHEMRLCD